ncbi:MAG TPA: C45 family peptidase, partial [Dictyobacter sp.]|nr:C45 family peptidase [Dictyobacter sp.]
HQAHFKRDIKRYLKHALEEIQGIADGAGLPFEDVFLLQMFEEVYEQAASKIGMNTVNAIAGYGCTTVNGNVHGKRFNGQNKDYTLNFNGKPCIFRYTWPGKQLLMYGFVGQVGGIGVNSNGLSLFVTTLPQGKKRDDDGLGATFVCRLLLEQDTVDEAIALLRQIPHFSTLSLSIADWQRQVLIERSADEMVILETSEEHPYLIHTNYIQALQHRKDLPPYFVHGEPVRGMIPQNIERYEYTTHFFKEQKNTLEIHDLLHMFCCAPVNMKNQVFQTLQSGLVLYEERSLTYYVAQGNEPQRGWNSYTFHKDENKNCK